MIAVGPLTSLLTGATFLSGYALWNPTSGWATVAHLLLLSLGLTSLVIGVATLIPSQTGGFKSDGRRLLELWRGDPVAKQTNMFALLTASSLTGIRPRNWQPQQVALVASYDETTPTTATIAALLYARALDVGDLPEARAQLQRTLDLNHLLPAVARSAAYFEAAFFEAWFRKDLAQAEQFMPKTDKDGLGEPQTRLMAQAAVSLLHQDFSKAQTLLDQAEAALAKTIDPGTAHLTREQIADMRQQAAHEQ